MNRVIKIVLIFLIVGLTPLTGCMEGGIGGSGVQGAGGVSDATNTNIYTYSDPNSFTITTSDGGEVTTASAVVNSIKGNWKTACIYVNTSNSSILKALSIDTNTITRTTDTYTQNDCSDLAPSSSQIVNNISIARSVTINGYSSFCITTDDGTNLVYHLDGSYLYDVEIKQDQTVVNASQMTDCSSFDEAIYDIQFTNPYLFQSN